MTPQEQFMQDATASANTTAADLQYAQANNTSLMGRQKAEPNIKRNPKTGEVAVQIDGAWEIFPNEQEAAQSLMSAVATHPDVTGETQNQNILSRLNDAVKRYSGAAQKNIEDFYGPGVVSSGLSSLVPGSLPELAGMGALSAVSGGLAPAALKLASPAIKLGSRVLAPTAASISTAALTGENPVTSGLSTLAGTLVPEAVGLAYRGAKRAVSTVTSADTLRKLGVNDALNFLKAAKDEVGAFFKLKSSTPQDLLTLLDPSQGKKMLRDTFAAVDEEARKTLGNTKVLVPTTDRRGFTVNLPMEVSQAQDTIKLLKDLARQAPASAEGFTIRQQARTAEEAYRKALGRADPGLLLKYDQAVSNYGKGLGVLDILKNSGAIAADERGVMLNNSALSKYLLENAERFPAAKYPSLWKVANRDGPLGATDVTNKITPRAYIPGTSVGVSGPTIQTFRRAGQEMPPVLTPARLQTTADIFGISGANSLLGQQDNE